MALTVEDGTGLAAADAYVSVADADSYHADHGDPSAWSGATTSAKETGIRLATEFLDAKYKLRWKGSRSTLNQGLDWIRYGVVDESGFVVGYSSIPSGLADACAVLALKQVEGTALIPDIVNAGTLESERVKVGPIEEGKSYTGGKGDTDTTMFALAERLISALVRPAGMAVFG